MLDINEITKAQPHYYVRATYMDIHTIGCTIEPLSLGIFKKVCWYGKFVFISVMPSRSVRQKWRCAILRTTYIWKRSSRAGTISTLTILSHTPRHAQPLSALPVVYVKGSRNLKLSQRESTFYVSRPRVTWRIFIFDEHIAKTKIK